MANKSQVDITLKIDALVQGAEKEISKLASAMEKITLPKAETKSIDSQIAKMKEKLSQFYALWQKEDKNATDYNAIEKMAEQINISFNKIKQTVKGLKFSDKEIFKLLPEDFQQQMEKAERAIKEVESVQKEFTSAIGKTDKAFDSYKEKIESTRRLYNGLRKTLNDAIEAEKKAKEELASKEKQQKSAQEAYNKTGTKKRIDALNEDVKAIKSQFVQSETLVQKHYDKLYAAYQQYLKDMEAAGKSTKGFSFNRYLTTNDAQKQLEQAYQGSGQKKLLGNSEGVKEQVLLYQQYLEVLEKITKAEEFLKTTAAGKDLAKANEEVAEATDKVKEAIDHTATAKENLDNKMKNVPGLQTLQDLKAKWEQAGKGSEEAGAKFQKAFEALKNKLKDITGIDFSQITSLKELQNQINTIRMDNIRQGKQDFEALKNAINSVDFTNFINGTQETTTPLREQREELERNSREIDNLTNRFKQLFSLTSGINLLRRAIRQAFQTIKELDEVMTQTAVVSNYSVSDMWKMLPTYTANAKQLGVAITEVYNAQTLYIQQGLDFKTSMDLGVESLKMARIANIDAASATQAMTAALRGFNMELNETSAQRINDVYSELAKITAADTQQISTAMTKTASIAHSANMEFETTAALLSQIIETTQEAPETAGTAMKTIIGRFTEIKKLYSKGELEGTDDEGEAINVNRVSTALRAAGINLNEFFTGAKGLDSIFLELSSKWNDLDIVTQRYIATMAAGSRQQSRFIAMMQDYARTTELVTAAENSAGSSQEQFNKTLDSMQSKLAALKDTWNEFVMGIMNSEWAKTAVDAAKGLLEQINKLTNGSNSLITALMRIGTIAGGLKLGSVLTKGAGKLISDKILTNASDEGIRKILGNKGISGFVNGLFGTLSNSFKNLKEKAMASIPADKEVFSSMAGGMKGALKQSNWLFGEKSSLLWKSDIGQNQQQKAIQSLKQQVMELTKNKKVLSMNNQELATYIERTTLATRVTNLSSGELAKCVVQSLFGSKATRTLAASQLTLSGATEKSTIALMAQRAAMMQLPIGWIVAAIAAIVAGIVVLVKHLKKIQQISLEEQIEESNKTLDELNNRIKSINNTIDDLTDKRQELADLREQFKDLEKGSADWNKKLIENNQQILELIEQYPILSSYLEHGDFGQLSIKSEGWEQLLKQQNKALMSAQWMKLNENSRNIDLKTQKLRQDVTSSGRLKDVKLYSSSALPTTTRGKTEFLQNYENRSQGAIQWGITGSKAQERPNTPYMLEKGKITYFTEEELDAKIEEIVGRGEIKIVDELISSISLKNSDILDRIISSGQEIASTEKIKNFYKELFPEYNDETWDNFWQGLLDNQQVLNEAIDNYRVLNDTLAAQNRIILEQIALTSDVEFNREVAGAIGRNLDDYTGSVKKAYESLIYGDSDISKFFTNGVRNHQTIEDNASEYKRLLQRYADITDGVEAIGGALFEGGEQIEVSIENMVMALASKTTEEEISSIMTTYSENFAKYLNTNKFDERQKSTLSSLFTRDKEIDIQTLTQSRGKTGFGLVKSLLGLDNVFEIHELYSDLGFDDLDDFCEFLEEEIEDDIDAYYNIWVGARKYLGEYAGSIKDDMESLALSITDTQNLKNTLNKIGENGGDIKSIWDWFYGQLVYMSDEERKKAIQYFTSGDFTTESGVKSTLELLGTLGITIDQNVTEELIQTVKAAEAFNLDKVKEEIKEVEKLGKTIQSNYESGNRTYDKEDYEAIIEKFPDLREFFVYTGIDEYTYTGKEETLLAAILGEVKDINGKEKEALDKQVDIGQGFEDWIQIQDKYQIGDLDKAFKNYALNGDAEQFLIETGLKVEDALTGLIGSNEHLRSLFGNDSYETIGIDNVIKTLMGNYNKYYANGIYASNKAQQEAEDTTIESSDSVEYAELYGKAIASGIDWKEVTRIAAEEMEADSKLSQNDALGKALGFLLEEKYRDAIKNSDEHLKALKNKTSTDDYKASTALSESILGYYGFDSKTFSLNTKWLKENSGNIQGFKYGGEYANGLQKAVSESVAAQAEAQIMDSDIEQAVKDRISEIIKDIKSGSKGIEDLIDLQVPPELISLFQALAQATGINLTIDTSGKIIGGQEVKPKTTEENPEEVAATYLKAYTEYTDKRKEQVENQGQGKAYDAQFEKFSEEFVQALKLLGVDTERQFDDLGDGFYKFNGTEQDLVSYVSSLYNWLKASNVIGAEEAVKILKASGWSLEDLSDKLNSEDAEEKSMAQTELMRRYFESGAKAEDYQALVDALEKPDENSEAIITKVINELRPLHSTYLSTSEQLARYYGDLTKQQRDFGSQYAGMTAEVRNFLMTEAKDKGDTEFLGYLEKMTVDSNGNYIFNPEDSDQIVGFLQSIDTFLSTILFSYLSEEERAKVQGEKNESSSLETAYEKAMANEQGKRDKDFEKRIINSGVYGSPAELMTWFDKIEKDQQAAYTEAYKLLNVGNQTAYDTVDKLINIYDQWEEIKSGQATGVVGGIDQLTRDLLAHYGDEEQLNEFLELGENGWDIIVGKEEKFFAWVEDLINNVGLKQWLSDLQIASLQAKRFKSESNESLQKQYNETTDDAQKQRIEQEFDRRLRASGVDLDEYNKVITDEGGAKLVGDAFVNAVVGYLSSGRAIAAENAQGVLSFWGDFYDTLLAGGAVTNIGLTEKQKNFLANDLEFGDEGFEKIGEQYYLKVTDEIGDKLTEAILKIPEHVEEADLEQVFGEYANSINNTLLKQLRQVPGLKALATQETFRRFQGLGLDKGLSSRLINQARLTDDFTEIDKYLEPDREYNKSVVENAFAYLAQLGKNNEPGNLQATITPVINTVLKEALMAQMDMDEDQFQPVEGGFEIVGEHQDEIIALIKAIIDQLPDEDKYELKTAYIANLGYSDLISKVLSGEGWEQTAAKSQLLKRYAEAGATEAEQEELRKALKDNDADLIRELTKNLNPVTEQMANAALQFAKYSGAVSQQSDWNGSVAKIDPEFYKAMETILNQAGNENIKQSLLDAGIEFGIDEEGNYYAKDLEKITTLLADIYEPIRKYFEGKLEKEQLEQMDAAAIATMSTKKLLAEYQKEGSVLDKNLVGQEIEKRYKESGLIGQPEYDKWLAEVQSASEEERTKLYSDAVVLMAEGNQATMDAVRDIASVMNQYNTRDTTKTHAPYQIQSDTVALLDESFKEFLDEQDGYYTIKLGEEEAFFSALEKRYNVDNLALTDQQKRIAEALRINALSNEELLNQAQNYTQEDPHFAELIKRLASSEILSPEEFEQLINEGIYKGEEVDIGKFIVDALASDRQQNKEVALEIATNLNEAMGPLGEGIQEFVQEYSEKAKKILVNSGQLTEEDFEYDKVTGKYALKVNQEVADRILAAFEELPGEVISQVDANEVFSKLADNLSIGVITGIAEGSTKWAKSAQLVLQEKFQKLDISNYEKNKILSNSDYSQMGKYLDPNRNKYLSLGHEANNILGLLSQNKGAAEKGEKIEIPTLSQDMRDLLLEQKELNLTEEDFIATSNGQFQFKNKKDEEIINIINQILTLLGIKLPDADQQALNGELVSKLTNEDVARLANQTSNGQYTDLAEQAFAELTNRLLQSGIDQQIAQDMINGTGSYANMSQGDRAIEMTDYMADQEKISALGLDSGTIERTIEQMKTMKEYSDLDAESLQGLALSAVALQEGLDEAASKMSTWTKELEKNKDNPTELNAIYDDIGKTIAKMLGTTAKLSRDFLKSEKTMQLLKKAIKGDRDAIAQLRREASKDILKGFMKSAGKTENQIEEVTKKLDTLWDELEKAEGIWDDLTLDNLDGDFGQEYLDRLNELVRQTGMSAEQIREYFATLGYNAELGETVEGKEHSHVTVTGQIGDQDFTANLDAETDIKVPTIKAITKNGETFGGHAGKSSGGGGGGGGGEKKEPWKNSFDRFHNLKEAAQRTDRERNKLEREYNNLLKEQANILNKNDFHKNLLAQVDALKQQVKYSKDLVEYYDELAKGKTWEAVNWMQQNADLKEYLEFDEETGEILIDWDRINQITDQDEGQHLEEIYQKLEEFRNAIWEAEDNRDEAIDKQNELIETLADTYADLREAFISMEERIRDAIYDARQKEIDELDAIYEAQDNNNSKILDGINEVIDEQRKAREQQKQRDELEEKQRRLTLLRQDTSGANSLEILALEKELQEDQENYIDSLVDNAIEEISKGNEKAQEQRDMQIELLQWMLDYDKDHGLLWGQVNELIADAYSEDGYLRRDSALVELLQSTEGFMALSQFGQDKWWDDLRSDMVKAMEGMNIAQALLNIEDTVYDLAKKNLQTDNYQEFRRDKGTNTGAATGGGGSGSSGGSGGGSGGRNKSGGKKGPWDVQWSVQDPITGNMHTEWAHSDVSEADAQKKAEEAKSKYLSLRTGAAAKSGSQDEDENVAGYREAQEQAAITEKNNQIQESMDKAQSVLEAIAEDTGMGVDKVRALIEEKGESGIETLLMLNETSIDLSDEEQKLLVQQIQTERENGQKNEHNLNIINSSIGSADDKLKTLGATMEKINQATGGRKGTYVDSSGKTHTWTFTGTDAGVNYESALLAKIAEVENQIKASKKKNTSATPSSPSTPSKPGNSKSSSDDNKDDILKEQKEDKKVSNNKNDILKDYDKKKSKIVKLDTGGYTGDWGSTNGKLAVLHQKELVLNAADTENFIQLRDILRDMDIGNPNTGITNYEIHIEVDEISDDYSVEQLADKVKDLIVEESGYRNVNQINTTR